MASVARDGGQYQTVRLVCCELVAESVREGDVHYLSVYGELDIASAPELGAELQRIEHSDAGAIILDLSGLDFIDSEGLRCLTAAATRSEPQRLRFLRPPPHLHRIFAMTGLDGQLPFID